MTMKYPIAPFSGAACSMRINPFVPALEKAVTWPGIWESFCFWYRHEWVCAFWEIPLKSVLKDNLKENRHFRGGGATNNKPV